ncbi:HECT domain [Phytophthora cactorum]|nr:HECT domain [Phytophthora cactorum]
MGCWPAHWRSINLRLAPLVWKMLVKQNLVLTDLESVDYSLCESLKFLEELASASSDDPNEVLYDSFTTTLSDGTVVELKTGGQQLSVTKANAKEYIRLVKATRLQECKPQVDAMLRGLGKIVPVQLLQLCVWLSCNNGLEIDVNLLKRHTRYSSGMSPEQFPHLEMFWKVLSSFSEENKRRFINFAWGQDTLLPTMPSLIVHTHACLKAPPQDSGMNQDTLLPRPTRASSISSYLCIQAKKSCAKSYCWLLRCALVSTVTSRQPAMIFITQVTRSMTMPWSRGSGIIHIARCIINLKKKNDTTIYLLRNDVESALERDLKVGIPLLDSCSRFLCDTRNWQQQ